MSNNKITQKILLIAVLLISFFGMNLEEGKGQGGCPAPLCIRPSFQTGTDCPTGATQEWRTVCINGCDYWFNYCYNCEPHHNQIKVTLNSWYKVCTDCYPIPYLTDLQIYEKIKEHVLNVITKEVAINCGITPCRTTEYYDRTMLTFVEYICWEKSLVPDLYPIPPGQTIPWPLMEIVKPCIASGKCETTYRVCWDTQTNEVILVIESTYDTNFVNEPKCPNWLSNFPWNGNFPVVTPLNPNSGCFRVKTACD